MKKVLIVLIVILIQSCGWNDEKWIVENDLVGNYKVIRDTNDKEAGYRLVLTTFDNTSYTPVIDNCSKFYLDSTNIYIESFNFNGDVKYSKIVVKENFSTLVDIREISKIKFDKIASRCTECKIIVLGNGG